VFEVGQRVHHARRGTGVIGGPSGDSVRVNFDDGAIGVVGVRDLRLALDSAAGDALLERLTDWRRERARADGVPAYVVADNKTLAALAAQRPSDVQELLGVPGIGQRKLETYGAEILKLVGDADSAAPVLSDVDLAEKLS